MTGHAIFDLDGTLVDSVAVCTQLLNGMLADRGSARTIAASEARPHVSLGGTRMVAALLGEECGDPELEIGVFRARYAELPTPSDSIYPGVRTGLVELVRRGVRLSICSNKPQRLCEKVLHDLSLDHLFDCVVGGRPGLSPKPAPALLDLTLDRLGIGADSCCFVGDSELDHAVAHAAGMPFVLVTYGYCDADGDLRDAIRCDSFAHVPDSVCAALGTRSAPVALRRASSA